jgi:hypothetical protein
MKKRRFPHVGRLTLRVAKIIEIRHRIPWERKQRPPADDDGALKLLVGARATRLHPRIHCPSQRTIFVDGKFAKKDRKIEDDVKAPARAGPFRIMCQERAPVFRDIKQGSVCREPAIERVFCLLGEGQRNAERVEETVQGFETRGFLCQKEFVIVPRVLLRHQFRDAGL